MSDKNAEEISDTHTQSFGSADGPIVRNVTTNVLNLSVRWHTFLYLFCGPKERIDVMYEASATTARMLENLLWDNCLMCIRRLTDNETSRGSDNLSLAQLVRIAASKSIDLMPEFEAVKLACDSARKYADKYIAHSDLEHSVGSRSTNVTRGQTTAAIEAITSFVQCFNRKVRNVHIVMDPKVIAGFEKEFLLRLHQGNQAETAAQKAFLDPTVKWDPRLPVRTDIPDWVHNGDFT